MTEPNQNPQASAEDLAQIEKLQTAYKSMKAEMQKAIVGQDQVIDELFMALFCRGHCVLIGVPGLAKTLMISTLSRVLNLSFSRIQFTPDLMPADITGTEVIQQDKVTGERSFKFLQGPVFANVILADEINRTPPKTQAALLEAMQEKQVTVGGTRHELDQPFFVLATQNPIEQEGTYPLPEAQMDRFLMKIAVDYPDDQAELSIVRLLQSEETQAAPPAQPIAQAHIFAARADIQQMQLAAPVEQYIVDLVIATRAAERYGDRLGQWIDTGSSPRASIALHRASRASAWLDGRPDVTPEDVRSVVHAVLRHRLILSYDALADKVSADAVIDEIIAQVAVG